MYIRSNNTSKLLRNELAPTYLCLVIQHLNLKIRLDTEQIFNFALILREGEKVDSLRRAPFNFGNPRKIILPLFWSRNLSFDRKVGFPKCLDDLSRSSGV